MNYKSGFSTLWIIGGAVVLSLAAILFYTVSGSRNGSALFRDDFSKGLESWTTNHVSNVPDQVHAEAFQDKITRRTFVDIERANSFGDGGSLGISHPLDIDASKLGHLYLKTDVRLFSHTLQGSGFYDDTLPDNVGVGEYPLMIEVSYLDATNTPKQYIWGFLEAKNVNKKKNYDVSDKSDWHTFVSGDLTQLADKPVKLTGVTIEGRGWDFHSAVGDISISDTQPSADSLAFKPTIPWLELPPEAIPKKLAISDVIAKLDKDLKACGSAISDWNSKYNYAGAKSPDNDARNAFRAILDDCDSNIQTAERSL